MPPKFSNAHTLFIYLTGWLYMAKDAVVPIYLVNSTKGQEISQQSPHKKIKNDKIDMKTTQ